MNLYKIERPLILLEIAYFFIAIVLQIPLIVNLLIGAITLTVLHYAFKDIIGLRIIDYAFYYAATLIVIHLNLPLAILSVLASEFLIKPRVKLYARKTKFI